MGVTQSQLHYNVCMLEVCVCLQHIHVTSYALVRMRAEPTIDSYKDSFTVHLCHCRLVVGDGC